MNDDEILLEIQRIGLSVRVSAFHVKTGTEIVFQAPTNAGKPILRDLAAKKMSYVLKKATKSDRK